MSGALALLFGATLRAQSATVARGTSGAEGRAVGAAVLAREIRASGIERDSAMRRDVAVVVERLLTAIARPEDTIRWELLARDDLNAYAAPGGVLLLTRGIVRLADSLASSEDPMPGNRVSRRRAYLAAVVAHEVAHMLLGHVEVAADRVRALVPAAQPLDSTTALRALTTRPALADSVRYGQQLELEADRLAALTLLRSGGAIADAQRVLRALDAIEAADDGGALRLTTYLRSHPRGSVREAALDQLKGTLKSQQARLDDALTLIRHRVALDTAITLLDSVLTWFPDLLAAQHARATAIHAQWLDRHTPAQLTVQTALLSYRARVIDEVRTVAALERAPLDRVRAAYADVLRRSPESAFTLAQLATLDAYAGEQAAARSHIAAALRNDSLTSGIWTNAGVVAFLRDDLAEARAAFARAIARSGRPGAREAQFNLARTLVLLDDSSAAAELDRAIALEPAGAWRDVAQDLRTSVGATAAIAPKAAPISSAPTVTSVSLSSTREQLLARLGEPDALSRRDGGILWRWTSRGIALLGDQRGVRLLEHTLPEAGTIAEVRVGDPLDDVVRRWGEPLTRDPRECSWRDGAWLRVVRLAAGQVTSVSVSRD